MFVQKRWVQTSNMCILVHKVFLAEERKTVIMQMRVRWHMFFKCKTKMVLSHVCVCVCVRACVRVGCVYCHKTKSEHKLFCNHYRHHLLINVAPMCPWMWYVYMYAWIYAWIYVSTDPLVSPLANNCCVPECVCVCVYLCKDPLALNTRHQICTWKGSLESQLSRRKWDLYNLWTS
jgi:hypothetical protein